MIYLLHSTVGLARALGPGARHYLGWCRDGHLVERLTLHRKGKSKARVVRLLREAGASFVLGAVWPIASRGDEKRLKQLGHFDRYCRVCHPDGAHPLVRSLPRQYRPRGASTSPSAKPGTPTGGS